MPELPEVETVRRALAAHAAGRRVVAVEGTPVEMRRPLDPVRIASRMVDRTLAEPRRRGKYLLLDVEPDGSLLVHLGMSGRLMLQARDEPTLPHTHLRLRLDDDHELRLVDPRRFGLAWWLDPGDEACDPALVQLGIEPLGGTLVARLPALLKPRRAPLKSLLLDQRLVAGIGNIYANEALWRAHIHPLRAPRRTSTARLEDLARAVEDVLGEAVAEGGTTIRDFASPEGNFGYFAVRLAAYGRGGLPCPRCHSPLRVAVLGARQTVWCPSCQR